MPTPAGELLIDGAVLNNFPVNTMREKLDGFGYIIGVNVGQFPEVQHDYAFDTSVSGWKLLASHLNPLRSAMSYPLIFETLLRSNDLKSIETLARRRRDVDLLIEPDVRNFALMDFRAYENIARVGYEEAHRRFREEGL